MQRQNVTIRATAVEVTQLDGLVAEGKFPSRSAASLFMVRLGLMLYAGDIEAALRRVVREELSQVQLAGSPPDQPVPEQAKAAALIDRLRR